jgi:hypothetical protein
MPGSDPSRRFARVASLCLLIAGWGSLADSVRAAPQLANLPIRGLQIGASTLLTLEGADLLPNPRVLVGAAGLTQTVKEGATPNRVQIEVTLPASGTPGMYQLRVVNDAGISNSILIGVDNLVQMAFGNQIARLPAALSGNMQGSETLTTSFAGKKGQRVVVDIEARRLGPGLDPVIELYDPRRVQIAYAQGQARLEGDARLEAILPEDGNYTIELHDALYQAGNPSPFRLKVGDLHYADLVFPLGGQRGTRGTFELVGSALPPGWHVDVDLRQAAGDVPAPLPPLPGFTGPAARIRVGDFPEVLQAETPAGKLQEVIVPAAINGRISKPGQQDRYRLRVKPGMALRFDVLANRAGSPLDAVLTLQNEAGGELAQSDDRPDTVDPGLDYTVPEGVQILVAVVRDLEGHGGPDYIYRLSVLPAEHPDFRLQIFQDRQVLRRGGNAILRVHAERQGYSGPIALAIPGLPEGIVLTGNEIPAGASDALLTLAASAEARPAEALLRVVGQAKDPAAPSGRRLAMLAENSVTRSQPWLGSEWALAVRDAAPMTVAWDTTAPVLILGSSYAAAVQVHRAAGKAGAVRLTLVTSQVAPRTPDGKQDDINRTLRFDTVPLIAPSQSKGSGVIRVPGDLPVLPYDVAIQAELLTADGKQVLASAVTPSRRLQAGQPFALELAGTPAVQAKSGAGTTGKLKGKLVRAGGFNKPVTVSLSGLPAELPAPMIMVPPDKTEFELPVAFPFGSKLGPLANVRLVARSQVTPQTQVQSNEIAVAVQVVAGEPPPPPPPLFPVFEDDAGFLALLQEGDGKMDLETVDRYSGAAALAISGGQRFRSHIPGWNFKIAEKPKTGEFRYLRFAWKKRGGNNILIQLQANGNWGPARNTPGPTYRYEAGPADNALQVAALKLAPRLPEDWVVVTRDLYADFGPFTLTGIAFAPQNGEYGLFDHVYLARSLDDLKGCPLPVTPEPPRAIFEDEPQFVADLLEGAGTARLEMQDKYSGQSSVKVTPDQRFNERLFGDGIRIRQHPGPNEYRFLQFAWKKKGGQAICFQINHDGQWGPPDGSKAKFRYHAGPSPECYGASVLVDARLPGDWVVVTRDLYADFGEFNWTGLALSPVDGEYALFDHIYLGRTTRDFELVKPSAPKK